MKETRVTAPALARMKRDGEKIVMLTAYDFPFARIFDQSGVDILLVGDSVGTTVQGHDTTLPVSLDEIIYHTRMVARAARRTLVIGDMPFGSYQQNPAQAVASACRLVKEGGAQAVKLEGGKLVLDRIVAIAAAGIPVMGHVGLTPQSVNAMGGFRVQGRGENGQSVIDDALAVQEAGAFAVVLEGIPKTLSHEITSTLAIPTIGIGAGIGCDGQVLVQHDLLGLGMERPPKFVREYVALRDSVSEAARAFADDVRSQRFPADAESYGG